MAEVTFYRCEKCGNLVAVVEKGTCVPQCCGEPMKELVAGSVDAAVEKHVPAVKHEDGKIVVQVGEVAHPMLDVHYISWIALATEDRLCIRHLKPGDEPTVTFGCGSVEGATIYAYCNLHGLWKAQV